MNDFLEQFLVESRELVEQATHELLALEETPSSREPLDTVFRAFHTLKGAAGIMEFGAMGRALHAAEEVLSDARAGDRGVTAWLVSDCLTCLDLVVQWLDSLEATGAMPGDAEASADAVIRRFVDNDAGTDSAESGDWVAAFAARHRAAEMGAVAIRYTPAADSFFQGLDPLAAFREAPGLRALELSPVRPWPPLGAFDPFEAQLVIQALVNEPAPAFLDGLRTTGDLQTVRLSAQPLRGEASPPTAATALLEAQVAMLLTGTVEDGRGKVGSAVRVAANVLRAIGRAGDAMVIEQLGRERPEAERVCELLQRVLAGVALAEPQADRRDAAPAPRVDPEPAARSLRVDVDRIDALVNLTGELSVAKNALGHAATLASEGVDLRELANILKGQHATMERLVRELQSSVLNMRVLPMRHVFQRFPRLVREMVLSLDKPVRLITEGDATEADKAIVENLFEPLLHVLRNALDHGVEAPEVRTAAGKPPSATIALRAHREGEHVIVEVEDDGQGIDAQRVRNAAATRGMASVEALTAMPDEEVMGLIFEPGFSTAASVTSLSGRGVGMDAVRVGVGRLGGRVSVQSQPGRGTCVRFTLPFTVVMSRVMTVEAAGQVFGIPLDAILETVRLAPDRLLPVGEGRAFVLRNRTIPVLDLAAILGGVANQVETTEANIVVAAAGGAVAGFQVERLGERLDVMLKPLGGLLAGAPGVSGTTLLGDGRVLLVLDVAELLQ